MKGSSLQFTLILACVAIAASCSHTPNAEWKVIELSQVPDPDRTPYPNGAAVCLCEDSDGKQSLIAIPAYQNRQILDSFKGLKKGSYLKIKLIKWADRSAESRAMFIANDFGHLYDLPLFFGE